MDEKGEKCGYTWMGEERGAGEYRRVEGWWGGGVRVKASPGR